jgi:integrase
MIKIYPTVRKRAMLDGSFPIVIAVSANRKTAYISTRYKIDSLKEWQNGKLIGRPDAGVINKKLRSLIYEYEDIVDEMPNIKTDASAVKEYILMKASNATGISSYEDFYMRKLKEERSKTYFVNMGYTLKYIHECFGKDVCFESFNQQSLVKFENYLRSHNQSDTTINIRMSHLKAFINSAINDGIAHYTIYPFAKYTAPSCDVRDICLSRDEFIRFRDADIYNNTRYIVARDLFLLSFYCAGINLTDIMSAAFSNTELTFIRKKTSDRKRGEKRVSITIPKEAKMIIDKYITADGTLNFGYKFSYENFRSYITRTLGEIGQQLDFESKLMFYSARKTFCQFGYELGIPLYILEYAIGQTIKDANNRPIFNYIKIMRSQADDAIRKILDYVK